MNNTIDNRVLDFSAGEKVSKSVPTLGAGVDASSAIEAHREKGDVSFKEKLENAVKNKDDEGLKEASKEFEAYFVNLLLKQMRKTVVDGGLIEKSESRKQFESMLDEEYAKMMSEEGGLGLSKAIYDAMKEAYG